MSYGSSKPPSPKPHFSSLSGGSKSSTTRKSGSGSQSPNTFADGGGKLSQKAPAISSHFEIDDHSFLSLSQQQEASTDVMRGLSPNVEPQNSFEPNSSIFSTSLAARSVVADAAAKHPTVHELVLQQKKRAQEVHAGKHGPSSFGHAKEKPLLASAEKQEKDRDRNMSLASCSSESTSVTADGAAADTDDCTNSDRTVTAGYMPSVHHSYPQGQPLLRDETSMTDDELLRYKNFFFEKYLKLTQEMERRNALTAPTYTHTTPPAAANAVTAAAHSGAVSANEKQPTKLLSAVQTMHNNARQQQQLLQQHHHPLPPHQPHPASYVPTPVPVEAPRASSISRLPLNYSPPPVPATVIFGPGPCRSKGSSPVVLSNMGMGGVSASVLASTSSSHTHTKPSLDHTDVVSNGTASSTDAKNLRARKQRSLSGGSESGFAVAAAAAAAQKLTQNSVNHLPLHATSHHPHPPQPHMQPQHSKQKNPKSPLDVPDSSPLPTELLPMRLGASLLHEPPEEEELVRAYMESQQQSQGGRSANVPHSDMTSTLSIHSRTSLRGGAVPPNEKMFAVSPASATQYSRSATPASIGPRQSSHSPSDNALATGAPQPVPPQRSQSSTPSQMTSRPHSRTSSASGSFGAGVTLYDELGDALPHSRVVSGTTNRGSSTPSGRLRKQKLAHSTSPNIEGPAAAQLMDPTYSFPTQLRGRQVSVPHYGRTASKDKDHSTSPGTGASLTASTSRSMETTEQDSRMMRSLAQQSPSLLVCVPKSLPLQQPRCVKTLDENSTAQDGDGSSVIAKDDCALESVSRAGTASGGGLETVLSSLRQEQQQHRKLYSVSSSSRDNLVPSPFSAFDELSQGSQSLSSNLSLSKQRPHRAATTSSSGSHLSIHDDLTDSRGTTPSRAAAATAETSGKKQHRLRKDP